MSDTRTISVIIPAYNEEHWLESTLAGLRKVNASCELIVVNDGSTDRTAAIARRWADLVINHDMNVGKGEALTTGVEYARGDILVFLDADLGFSAGHAPILWDPVSRGKADMSVAIFSAARKKGGFGLVKGKAYRGIYRLTGFQSRAPLSGQRALKREVFEKIPAFSKGFGIEVGMTIDVLKAGYRVTEIPVPFVHRETGRDLAGFLHRGKQFLSVSRALWERGGVFPWKTLRH